MIRYLLLYSNPIPFVPAGHSHEVQKDARKALPERIPIHDRNVVSVHWHLSEGIRN
jgi:hypothetical protein